VNKTIQRTAGATVPAVFCLLFCFLFLSLTAGCKNHEMDHSTSAKPTRDINAVLTDHSQDLMSKPGVVGVFVGLLQDNKTPCLKVIVLRQARDVSASIPKTIEGYPVAIDLSDPIRPMQ
jgi:hypothetical protein